MRPKTWTIGNILKVTAGYLEEKLIDSPRLTAEILLAHQLNVDRITLYLNFDQPLIEKEISGYRSLIRRRLQREPLQYITGIQEFWSLDFVVNPQVLIPRPETELLVEHAVSLAAFLSEQGTSNPNILDIGTGSGTIAVSLAKELPDAHIWAMDISPGALETAGLNAKKQGVSDRIEFMQGDLREPSATQGITFDIIVSNPPYVATDEFPDLPPEVRDHEPKQALDGKEGGLHFIEKIIIGYKNLLAPGGWIILEMAPNQTQKALNLMELIKGYSEKSRIKDYAGHYRMVKAKKI